MSNIPHILDLDRQSQPPMHGHWRASGGIRGESFIRWSDMKMGWLSAMHVSADARKTDRDVTYPASCRSIEVNHWP